MTPLHSFGEALRQLLQAIPLSIVRLLFVGTLVVVLLWVLRLPRSETETVNVTVLKTTPELCTDPLYVREKKPHNILRWDLDVKSGMNGEKAVAINFEFKVELDKNMVIGGFLTKWGPLAACGFA